MRQTNLLSTYSIKRIRLNKLVFSFLLFFSAINVQANDCLNIDYSWGNGAIDIEGLTAPIEIIDIYDGNWNLIFHCDGTDCGTDVNLTGLSPDDYHIKIQSYSAAWEFICRRDWDITIYAGSSNPDLTLDNLRDYATTMARSSVQTFTFDLKNIGNAPANDTYTINAYLTPTQGVSSNDVPLGEIVTGNIGIGTIPDVVGAITVPFDFPLGLYYLILQIEVNNFGDSDYSNNFVVTNDRIEVTDENNGGGGIQCGEINITYGNGSITMAGQSNQNYNFKIHDLNNGWNEIFSCSYQCGNRQTANLPPSRYLVRVYNSNWSLICEQEINLVDNGGGVCGEADADGDGICNDVDNCLFSYNPDQADRDGNGVGDVCQDNPPNSQLICPNDIIVETNDPDGAIVTWDDPDIIDGTRCQPSPVYGLRQEQGLPKGSKFPIGETTIFYTIYDVGGPTLGSCGTFIACEFSVIVNEAGSGGENTIQCGEISITSTSNSIEMEGQSGNNYFFKIHDLNNGWAEVFSCSYQCGRSQTASNLAGGRYLVRAYNDSWSLICEQEVNLGAGSREATPSLETFTLYPNPAQDVIAIDLTKYAGEKVSLSINNIYGQVVYEQTIEAVPAGALKINLADYVNGIYFANIKLNNRLLKSEKFLVKRLY